MKSSRKLSVVIFLALATITISSQAYAQQKLGIHFPHPQEARFSENLETAFSNLVSVHNYKDKVYMLDMLTRYNMLDAVLISKDAYNRHNSAALIPLTEVQISDENASGLVLATHSFLSKPQQEEILRGYQELLLSANGLELLEFYATGKGSLPKGVEPQADEMSQPKVAAFTPPPVETVTSQPLPKKQAVQPKAAVKPAVNKAVTTKKQVAIKKAPVTPAPAQKPSPEIQKTEKKQAATSKKLWRPHVDITGKLGNDKSLGEMELFVPLVQNHDRMFFLDLRFQLDDNKETEGNFGVGLRKIFDHSWILGGYAFYDMRESAYDNDFKQVTVGIEALTEEYDARVNVYLADDKDYLLASQESVDQVLFSGFNLVHQTGGPAFEIREKSMSGFDAEIGWKLPWFDKPEIRSYIGGYHFSASGVEDVSGPRGRVEVRLPDIFGWAGSLFELGGEVRHDDVRDTDYFISARGRIPFGSVTNAVERPRGISARMTERIQRDPDIVVAKQEKNTSTPLTTETLATGGDAISITHVDSQSTSGDGSVETPFNTLASAETLDNGIVLLYADSTFDGEGITLKPNQRLLGSSVAHSITTDQLGTITLPQFSLGTEMPIIQNFAGEAITLADGSEVSGIHLSGVTTAIYGDSVGGVNINRNVISNIDEGIVLEALIPHASTNTISSNNISNTFLDGIYLSNDDVTGSVEVEISDNQIQDVGGAGIIFDNSGSEMNLLISANDISGTTDEGIIGFNLPTGTTLSATVVGNTIDNVGDNFDGMGFVNTGDTLNLYLQDNYVDGDDVNFFADYYIDNLAGITFNLGATTGNAAIGSSGVDTDNGVIEAEGNRRADQATSPNVDAFGTISIVDKNTIPAP